MVSRSEEHKTKEQKGSQQMQPRPQMQPQETGGTLMPARRGTMTNRFEPFFQLREDFNRLFDHLLPGWPSNWGMSSWGMGRHDGWGLEMQEEAGNVIVRAEAPGFEASDFDLQVRGDQLVLHAAKKAETEEKDRGYHEWRQQEFYREIPLPGAIHADKVEAEYRNGVLTVKLPKTEESTSHRIEVKG